MTRLSKILRSLKNPHPPPRKSPSSPIPPSDDKVFPVAAGGGAASHRRKKAAVPASNWSVYLIISCRLPRTYVGVTNNFPRRLKQHNGELKGGAKASSAGRPWDLACIVRGFKSRSEACEFESKWKNISKKMPRKKKKTEESTSNSLLLHREAALNRVEASSDSIQFEWILCAS